MAQSCHVCFSFSQEHPELTKDWMFKSNYIAILEVANEEELIKLIDRALTKNIKHSIFRESDMSDQITAVALEPSILAKKLCSSLPLACK